MEAEVAEEKRDLLEHNTQQTESNSLSKNGVSNMKADSSKDASSTGRTRELEPSLSITNKCMFFIIRCIVYTYDIITFPLYFFLQRPWNVWKANNKIWAQRLNVSDPYSPYIRLEKLREPWNDISTMDQLFRMCVSKYGPRKCCGHRELLAEAEIYDKNGKKLKKVSLGDYKWFTYYEIDERVDNLCNALIKIGLEPKKHIVILSETRLEWLLILQSCFRLNIPIATLYPTLSEEGIVHGINETGVSYIFSSQACLLKLMNIIDEIPGVTNIIYMEDIQPVDLTKFQDKVTVISLSQVEAMPNEKNVTRPDPPSPSDVAILMYTSGSTGVPKGVQMSHITMVRTAANVIESADPFIETDIYIGYLPLAHAFEILAEFCCFSTGVPVGYGSPYTLTDKSIGIMPGCKGDATLLKPTVICAVPLMLDKMRKAINDVVRQKSPLAQEVFKFAVQYKSRWYKRGYGTPVLNRLVFKKVKALFGGNVRFMVGAGAPLSPDTHDFIRMVIDTIMVQAYGLTETCGGANIMSLDDRTTGRVGPPFCNTYMRIVDWPEGNYFATDKPNPRGEIVLGGQCITGGYYKKEDITREVFKEENGVTWFYTGDIGEVYPDGALKVIDRKKDLVKLQYGEYISLGKVESELKTCAFIDNICVIGNSYYNYLVALVSPNPDQLKNIAQELDKERLSFAEQCEDADIAQVFTQTVKEYAKRCKLERAEIPAKFKLCSEEWMPESGFVTTAFKIKRKAIEQFYHNFINEMYGSDST